MIECFEYYLTANLVRKQKADKEEAKYLMKKAVHRLNYIKKQEIKEDTASFIFEDIYESLREASQSLMSLKATNHILMKQLISFLRDFYKFSGSDISTFDRFRVLRNKTVYSAVWVSVEVCQDALAFLEDFLPKLSKEFENSNV